MKFVIKYVFGIREEFTVFLGTVRQEGTPVAIIKPEVVWKRETRRKRMKSIARLSWKPSVELIQSVAREVLYDTVFGNEKDYGPGLFKINLWHNSREWNLTYLTEFDLKRAKGLQAMSVLLQTRHNDVTSFHLNLNLGEITPALCVLLHGMVVKIPVISIRYYFESDAAFCFNEIRKANYPDADDLIAYIYDLQFIQQKIALSLHEYLCLVDFAERQKASALLINAELSAIIKAEVVFTYLKASIEKTMVVLGLIYGIKNLDSKKTHKSKLNALEAGIPSRVKSLFYFSFLLEFIQSENIDELNNYRSGILHKKGIADLQLHNYVGQKAADVPLKKIFSVLTEQHSKNTAALICLYALLTDELVHLDPPTVKPEELPGIAS